MTGPDRPTPQPLPAPGPPPAPAGCVELTQPGPGPKPDGPTGPTPTGPGRLRGHLPIAALLEYRLPYLDQVISDARNDGTRMLSTLARWYDPMSVAVIDPYADPTTPDIYLAKATSHVKSALRELDQLAALGSASTYPGSSDSSACLSGGSASHPVRRPDEGLLPGLAAGAGFTSARSDGADTPLAGANHLAVSVAASGGLLPGLADATPSTPSDIDESEAIAPCRDAGVDPDPRPARIGSDAPEMTGDPRTPDEQHSVRPGVGFLLPQAAEIREFFAADAELRGWSL